MLAQFVKSSRDTDDYKNYEFLNIYYGNQQLKSFSKVYCKYFNKMQTCKLPKERVIIKNPDTSVQSNRRTPDYLKISGIILPKFEKGPVIDKPISTLWARYVEEFTEQNLFPECCGIGFMRNSSHFAFVFCFEQDYNFKIESSFSKGIGSRTYQVWTRNLSRILSISPMNFNEL